MSGVSRATVEDFLYHEAELLDAWMLNEWLALFTEDGTYLVPSTDADPQEAVTADPHTSLFLIHDSMSVLRSRVRRLLDRRSHSSNPRARTRHFISNVRIQSASDDVVRVRADFMVSSARNDGLDLYVGECFYTLIPTEGSFRIRERRAVLDLEALVPTGSINFVL